MLIEIYNGVKIIHDAKKDLFISNVAIILQNGKDKCVLSSHRLQALRDSIDKYLATSAKKPTVKKGFAETKYTTDLQPCTIYLYSALTQTAFCKLPNGRVEEFSLSQHASPKLYLSCKENNALVKSILKVESQLSALRAKKGALLKQLLPVKISHFE